MFIHLFKKRKEQKKSLIDFDIKIRIFDRCPKP